MSQLQTPRTSGPARSTAQKELERYAKRFGFVIRILKIVRFDPKQKRSGVGPQFNCELDSMLISANTIMCPLRQEDRLMKIELNHTIVPAQDKEKSARFYERILGFKYEGPMGHFAQVRIPSQSLSLDFDNSKSFQPHHYAFKVGEAEFDDIFGRVKEEGLAYGSGPFTPDDMKINNWNGGRGVYFRDPGGHLLELLTKDYSAETMPK